MLRILTCSPAMPVGLVLTSLVCSACRSKPWPEGPPSTDVEKQAQHVWDVRCSTCHGAGGKGDGPLAANLGTKPRDFSDRAWQAEDADSDLAEVITRGGAARGHSADMPPSPDLNGKPDVVRALVQKVRGFGR